MDQKIRLWRKKSSEKTIIASDMTDVSLKGNEEEVIEDSHFISDNSIFQSEDWITCIPNNIQTF